VVGYPTFEKIIKIPFFYDLDDAIFLGKGKTAVGIKRLVEGAAANFAGNQYLADFCKQYSSKVFVIPTAVDTDRFVPVSNLDENRGFVIGWSGTSSSFKFFKPLEMELTGFLKHHKGASLKICSDRFPHELTELAPYIQFERWTPKNEEKQIQSFSVGIMPLENSDWVKGKCAYKSLLYASCGVPTIADAYGMSKDVLALGRMGIGCEGARQWRDALEFVYMNRESLPSVFPDCRRIILENFSVDIISTRISKEMLAALGR
jgi:glycosyltransferase involved in cell wall biosynthesis